MLLLHSIDNNMSNKVTSKFILFFNDRQKIRQTYTIRGQVIITYKLQDGILK